MTAAPSSAREEFLTHPPGKLIARHATPAVASMLFMAFYQITDGIMVGRSLGPEAMASVNILYPIVALLSGLAVMIGVGGNARIAVLLGAGKPTEAGRVLGLLVSLGVVLGVAGSIAAVVFMPWILSILGTSGQLGLFAAGYLQGILPFFTFMVLAFILEQSLRNDGKPNLAGGVMALSALLNIALDYLFLFVLELGIAGAAVASGISQSLAALVFVGYFVKKGITVRREDARQDARSSAYQRERAPSHDHGHAPTSLLLRAPDWSLNTIRAVVVNGSSEFFNSISMGVTTFLFNRLVLLYVGAMGVAALTVVQYPMMLGVMVIMGIGSGTQPIFSFNHGAGLHRRVRSTLVRTVIVASVAGFLVFLLMGAPAARIAALFLPGHDEALALTQEVSRVARWSMLFLPTAMVASVYFTALEQAGRSLIVALSRGLILPVTGLALFPLLWGATGIWITIVFTEAVSVVIAVGCYGIPVALRDTAASHSSQLQRGRDRRRIVARNIRNAETRL